MYDYKKVDKAISQISRKNIELFSAINTSVIEGFDELNILSQIRYAYAESLKFAKKKYKELYYLYYLDVCGVEKKLTNKELDEILEKYDFVVKYIFTDEFERKKQRLIEAVVADIEEAKKLGYSDKENLVYIGETISEDIDRALRLIDYQERNYTVTVADEAVSDAMEENDVELVQWITNIDGRECEVCRERHLSVYELSKFPSKPHPNCRCRKKPFKQIKK